ncbi:MAG TPA: winged helix-turn-helix domain-containing protein [Opitutaceae bacterium]|nr:winged helix-turn-helix domain-containing protein [Opitutaceae bacterium]
MDLLPILFPQVRAAVLRLLFADPAAELHLRDLTRRSGLALGTIQTELAKLTGAQLVVSERDGNRRYYRANAAHPLFPALQQLVLQTTASTGNPPPLTTRASDTPQVAEPTAVGHLASAVSSPPAAASHTLTLNELD